MRWVCFFIYILFSPYSNALGIKDFNNNYITLEEGGNSNIIDVSYIYREMSNYFGVSQGDLDADISQDKRYIVFSFGVGMNSEILEKIYVPIQGSLIHLYDIYISSYNPTWKKNSENVTLMKCCYDSTNINHSDLENMVKDKYLFNKNWSPKEIAMHIDDYNVYAVSNLGSVQKANDVGFYLSQDKKYDYANIVLADIINKHPARVVAHLNYADNLYDMFIVNSNSYESDEKKDIYDAISVNYNLYIKLMTKLGKEIKIPPRVYERLKFLSKVD
ncbi:hypothetical protein ACKC9G_12910 [Pokkaliibacter sp. CJK22405]|uniref:hypothetical protein n=1 Tax=Pokkaliibacter sp. CJK22405 TaxID=3384615 RepID=UPI003984F0A1